MSINLEVTTEKSKSNKNGHTVPKAPVINLDQMGRLRVSHLMALLGISHSTLYAGIASQRYPKPDGKDGRMTYWKTSTIKSFLEA